jgi:hypothetical protein
MQCHLSRVFAAATTTGSQFLAMRNFSPSTPEIFTFFTTESKCLVT